MATQTNHNTFSEHYGELRTYRAAAREDRTNVGEDVVQAVWYDQLFRSDGLKVDDGRTLRVVSPGWWNHGEGPDFKGAQLEFNGKLVTGDVEVDLAHSGWTQHGHHASDRFANVKLHVVLESEPPSASPRTVDGKPLPSLLLRRYLDEEIGDIASRIGVEDYPYERVATHGTCAALVEMYGSERLEKLLGLAGEWRMLNKARSLRERMEKVGPDQAIYESFLSACGYSRFKHAFRALAQQLPYDRVAQLAGQNPVLVEAAFLHMAGLLPDDLGTDHPIPHFDRLTTARRDHLAGLRPLGVSLPRTGVRPTNYPERRLAGAALFISRNTKTASLSQRLEHLWRGGLKPIELRRAFEEMFPGALGFWGSRCTWTGKTLSKASAPIGPSRVRSIIGNVFVPAGLAMARQRRDRRLEEDVLEFFAKLPKESDDQILKVMIPRLFGDTRPPKLTFRTQQGLLQMYADWCEPNPSCRNCSVITCLDVDDKLDG